ncbi:MAG TPA: ribokinase [Firmicutes bacterium]|nr:ribokinase [Bacillota bacterium]
MQRKDIPQIYVIGSINNDLVASVKNLPLRGETIHSKAFRQHLGGKGANQAVAAALLGGEVTMVGCVGKDDAGRRALAGLADAGINKDFVRQVSTAPTGTALITVDEAGDNTIVVVPGANAELKKADVIDIKEGLAEAAAVVLQLEVLDEVVLETAAVVSSLRAGGQKRPWLVFNPSPFRSSAVPPAGSIDLLLVNELEAAAMSGIKVSDPKSALTAAKSLLPELRRGGCVVVTLGTQGAVALAAEKASFAKEGAAWYIPAQKVAAVDTTGAGDVFTGGFVGQLAAGATLQEALRYATAAAALTVTRQGAQSSFPSQEETQQMLLNVKEPQKL